jgi:cardiolipin synthase C
MDSCVDLARALPKAAFLHGWLALLLALASVGCATLSPAQHEQAAAIAVAARSSADDCGGSEDRCALPSPLAGVVERVRAESTQQSPRHSALIIEQGPVALMARIHLMRSARHSIDLQTYIFDEDDAGQLVLDELLAAARRGVQVRLLIDQNAALREVDTQARLASSHRNFALRLYNPARNRGRSRWRDYIAAAGCCFRELNQRLHSKLLLIDGEIAINGGRNYQNDYYDWDPEFNFRDRELLLVGPAVRDMQAHFEAFWQSPRSLQAERLDDVGRRLLQAGAPAPATPRYVLPQRADSLVRAAADPALVQGLLVAPMLQVGAVQFVSDTPDKHVKPEAPAAASAAVYAQIAASREEVLLQTPYLVLSPALQALFSELQQRPMPPRVRVSTNSLASTDNPPAYALAYRNRQRLMDELKFELHEYKPFPNDAPIDVASTGAQVALPLALNFVERVPSLRKAGVSAGLHAKAMVIDGRVGVIGTSNFDARGEHYNIESVVLIDNREFAASLAASIRRDMAPANSWPILAPVRPGAAGRIGAWLSRHPLLDLWPFRFGSNYEAMTDVACEQQSPGQANLERCQARIGDFPETSFIRRSLTRVLTSFGAGLAPVL